MADKDVNITYETLFEILRREKGREDLQELQESFFNDVVEYLKDKTRIMGANMGKLFSDEEMEKTRMQIANVKKILRELYDRREKKIISMALNKSRTKSNIMNTSVLLGEEKELYEALINVLDVFRDGVITNVVNERQPELKKAVARPDSGPVAAEPAAMAAEDKASEATGPNNDAVQKKAKTIRFLKPIPKFIGSDLRIYGPFEEEDIANLPEETAIVLIEKGRAEEIGVDN